ncbi:hypothetical protein DXG01_007862 [Tephrocybe rancida]|nr:hypothetical protein DXG01_007862 [Tephrocybe rancida]
MRTTRSTSRAQAPTAAASTLASEGKRKIEEEPKEPIKKRARVAKATPAEQKSKPAPVAATATEPSTATAVASNDAARAHPMVPAVLTFSFEEGKKHLISVDHRFDDLFSKMQCKPYEHLETVHPFRGQQISWLAARSVNHKFVRLFDPSIPEKIDDYPGHGKSTSFYPSPEAVAKTDIPTLRTAGLSQRKAEYVLDLAERFADGRLSTDKLINANDEELAKMLIEVRGIGRWTVDMFAIFSLRRPDILPVGDLGVQRGLVVWFLSLHSSKHSWGWTPQKVASSSAKKGKAKKAAAASAADTDTLPAIGEDAPSTSNVDELPTPDISSVPPAADEEAVDDLPSLPPTFTPSIKSTLKKPAVNEGSTPNPLPEGLTIDLLKSRLAGKNKVKGAILTPKEMEDLTESWKPYRSLGLMDSPLSPSDPQYSSPLRGYPSPAESDTLQTPFFDQKGANGALIRSPGGPDDVRIVSEVDFSPLPALFDQPATPRKKSASYPAISMPDYGSPMKFDLDASFNDYEHPGDGSYDSEPFSIVLSNPLNLDTHPLKTGKVKPSLTVPLNLDATLHSPHFPPGHKLNPHFVRHYKLEDELGSGGYGFVMTARHRLEGHEVAVKFIVKSKVPDHAWMEDETIGRLPTEVMLLSFIEHDNIVKCLDLFEDSLFFYLIQELHGSPWPKFQRQPLPTSPSLSSLSPSTPALSPSISLSSLPSSPSSSPRTAAKQFDGQKPYSSSVPSPPTKHRSSHTPKTSEEPRPEFTRRPSHDLFECIEQSEHKRLSEQQARYVFAQVVDAVDYLESQGVTHRDIKDENLVIDQNLKVKLIDFGSATVVDPAEPRPYYSLFYGTTAYASPEILLKKKYQAPPAEIWTMGVLLSYLLTGTSPFPTVKDAIKGRMVLSDNTTVRLSKAAMSLMRRCLDPDPQTRATIAEIKAHRWFTQRL